MILFVAFVCFMALLSSVFIPGHIKLEVPPHFSGQFSYMEVVAILSLILLGWLVFVKMIKKIVLGPLGWYDSFTKRRQLKAANKALQGYMLELGGQKDGMVIFDKYQKTLSTNPFYWMCGFLSGKEELVKRAYIELVDFENGDFCELFYKVNRFLEDEEYKSALSLLEVADNFAHKTVWFWEAMFSCYIEMKNFDKAEMCIKPLRSLGQKTNEYELILHYTMAENDIDKLENLEKAYKLDDAIAGEYVKELLNNKQVSKAEKIIKEVWEDSPNMELGLLLDEVYADLVPVEHFSSVSEIFKQHEESYIAQYLLAKSALGAGLFLIAREKLMELAENYPLLAFPLLAKLEKVEKHDLEASNRWLEKAVKHLGV